MLNLKKRAEREMKRISIHYEDLMKYKKSICVLICNLKKSFPVLFSLFVDIMFGYLKKFVQKNTPGNVFLNNYKRDSNSHHTRQPCYSYYNKKIRFGFNLIFQVKLCYSLTPIL